MSLDNQINPDVWGLFFSDKQLLDDAHGNYLLKKTTQKTPSEHLQEPINMVVFNEGFFEFINTVPSLICSVLKIGDKIKGYFPQPDITRKSPLWESICNLQDKVNDFLPLLDKAIISGKWQNAPELDQILELHLNQSNQYQDIRRIYWYIYCELKVTLRLFAKDSLDSFEMVLGQNFESWIRLREHDLPVLAKLASTPTPRDETELLKIEEELRVMIQESRSLDCKSSK